MNELYNESTCQASRMCGFLLKILLLILSLYLNYIPTFSELMIIPSIHYLKFENQHFKYPGILQMCNSFSHSWKAPKTPKDWYNYTIITIIHTEVHMVSHVWSLHLATWTKQVKILCLMQCVCCRDIGDGIHLVSASTQQPRREDTGPAWRLLLAGPRPRQDIAASTSQQPRSSWTVVQTPNIMSDGNYSQVTKIQFIFLYLPKFLSISVQYWWHQRQWGNCQSSPAAAQCYEGDM